MSKRNRLRILFSLWMAGSTCAASADGGAGRDWPTWRGDAARSGVTSIALPADLHLRWTRQLETPEPAWPESQPKIRFDAGFEPVVVGKRLFLASMVSDRITAYDTESGAELWRFYTDGPVRFAPLVWKDGVYAVSDDGRLYCLDAASGKLRWSVRGGPDGRLGLGNERLISLWPARGAPVLWEEADGQGTIYFAASIWPFMGIFIHAVDATSGHIRWTNSGSGSEYQQQQHDTPAYAGVAPQGYMAVAEDILLVSGGRTVPAAYDRHTGAFRYLTLASRAFGKAAGGYDVQIAGNFIINNGCIYNLTNGTPVRTSGGSPLDGAFLESTVAGLNVRSLAAPPAAGGIAAPDGEPASRSPLAWDAPGKRLPPTPLTHFFCAAGGRAYGARNGGWIGSASLDGSAGAWRFQVAGGVWNMVPADDKLFVVTTNGSALYCFGAAPGNGPTEHKTSEARRPTMVGERWPGGYALVWGLGSNALERLQRLAVDYRVVAIDPDPVAVEQMRRQLDEAGLYGRRVHVLAGDPMRLGLPSYIASRLEFGDLTAAGVERGPDFAREAFRCLRPYGGAAVFTGATALRDTLSGAAALATLPGARLMKPTMGGDAWELRREGPLPGSAPWTHQYGDVANTVMSQDLLVKPPLGLLWFGGPSNDEILPRHGHGPTPLVIGGRLFIEGPDMLRAIDVYTGRLLWQRAFAGLGQFYDSTLHQPGAGEIGSNLAAAEDGVFVVNGDKCRRLDPATGATLGTYTLPKERGSSTPPRWGYLGVTKNFLIAGATPTAVVGWRSSKPHSFDADDASHHNGASKLANTNTQEPTGIVVEDGLEKNLPYASASRRLVVFSRSTGGVLWTRQAGQAFRHNGIVAGAGRIFCLDAFSPAVLSTLASKGAAPKLPATLYALDARSGRVVWSTTNAVRGTWLGYEATRDTLLLGGSPGNDRAADEFAAGLAAYRGLDGRNLWSVESSYRGTPILHPAAIYTDGAAIDWTTGQSATRRDPITGLTTPWSFSRAYGCNTPIGCPSMLLFRSASASFYDLAADSGTANLGGFKSGCTASLIPADGVVTVPDYTRTCTCSYQNQSALGLVSMPDVEFWTMHKLPPATTLVERVGINLGAPGDWPAPDGTLWLNYPGEFGATPRVGVHVLHPVHYFRGHASEITGPAPQITASGVEGAAEVWIPLHGDEERSHTVRLYFAEPDEAVRPGERVFDVLLQGAPVLEALDIVEAAGGARRSLIKTFHSVAAGPDVTVELRPRAGSKRPPILGGVEVVREDALSAQLKILAGLGQPTVSGKDGCVTAWLTVSNRTEALLPVALTARLRLPGVAPTNHALELPPRGSIALPMDIPTGALNSGAFLDTTMDLGESYGRFHLVENHFPLEISVPLAVEATVPSLRETCIQLRSLLPKQPQSFSLTVRIADTVLLEKELVLPPKGTNTVMCPLPKGLLGHLSELEVTTRWPASVSVAQGRFVQKLDFHSVYGVARRTSPGTGPAPVTLTARNGLYPEDRRSRLKGSDDLEAGLRWCWDGASLVVTVHVKDDQHFNAQHGDMIWNGDSIQIGFTPLEGLPSNMALALTSTGPALHLFTGADKDLASKVKYSVTRDDTLELATDYELRVPLAALGIRAEQGTFFRMNLVIFDDDRGAGFSYWRQFAPGLAGSFRLLDYPVFALEE